MYWLSANVAPDVVVDVECITRPLDVFKQMLVMFCSASPPGFAQKHPKLVRYLMNPGSRDADDQRIFISVYDWHNSIALRQTGLTARIDLSGGTHVFAEISYPPFNIVMTVDGSASPDPKLFEITWFKNYGYHETVPVRLKLSSLSVASVFPADYRTLDELKAQGSQADAGNE
jgi:hypothetical protein